MEILVPDGSHDGLVAAHIVVERMGFLGQRHPILDLPCVELSGERLILHPKVTNQLILRAYVDVIGIGC